MPPAHRGPTGSPMDRWTDASPTAISSGFQSAMSLGPQPRLDFAMPASSLGQNMTSANFNTDDEDDEDDEDEAEGVSPSTAGTKKGNGKAAKGKKTAAAKNKDSKAKAAQHRKEQNRAAQREFRQRKQQYIRALEARVELLSSDHDTQVNRLRYALRHLLAENNSLRTMVGSLAHFIGKRSIGGCLVEAGMTRDQLEATMNSSSEKVMSEAWANWPGAGECEALKEIRKESNIPPEGLPESKLPNYFRESASKNASENTAYSAPGEKKKRTIDDASGKDAKRNRKADEASVSSAGAGGGPNPVAASSGHSSPSNPQANGIGQPFTASPQNMTANDMNQSWQQQDQALPSQFWQPSSMGFGQSLRNDVDSMFAQTFLGGGGGNPEFSNIAAMASSMFPNNAANQNLFSPQDAASFSNLIPNDPNAATNYNFASLTSSAPGYPDSTGAGYANSQIHSSNSNTNQGYNGAPQPGRATVGGMPTIIVPDGSKASPEQVRALRRRHARAVAQVNRIWVKRGASAFLNVVADYQLVESDIKFIQDQEAHNPHIKIAFVRLPNGWDEGDLSGQRPPDASSTNAEATMTERIEKAAGHFMELSYHIHNHRMNPHYSLPPLLRPTAIQRSIPHDLGIDTLPWPSIREKLIQDTSLDLYNIMIDVIRFTSPEHGDINSERTWVLQLPFWIRYPQLADPKLLACTNQQRASRGEPEFSMDEVWMEHRRFQEYTQAKLQELD